MRVDNIVQSLRVLAQADTMIANITFRYRLSQIALYCAALLITFFGLIMLGMGGYRFLRDLWGPIWAALATALGSFALALLVAVVAAYRKPGREMQMAREMHTVALDSLIAEAKLTADDFSLINGIFHGRLDAPLLGLIGSLASLFLRFLRRAPEQKSES